MSCFVQRFFYLAVAFLLLWGSAMGAVKKWEGDVSSDWNNANNWQGNVFPGAANDALIDPANYTNAPVISSNSSHSFKKLTIQNGGLLTVQADLGITDDLLVTGTNSRLNITAGTLSISSGNKNIQVYAGGTVNHSGGTISNTGVVDIQNSTYNLSGTGILTPGTTLDLTASSANTLFNMTGGTCTISTSMSFIATNTISTTVSISGGTFTNNGPTYFNNAETDLTYFNVSGGTATLAGVVQDNTAGKIDITVSSTGSLKFQNNVTMEAGDLITQTGGTITFEGGNRTWTNAGTLNATGGTIVFNDATATVLTGAGTWGFYNVTINSGKVLTATAPTNINVAGNWTNSGGTFNEGTKRVTFNGTATQTVTAETFYDLTINKTAGTALTLSANVVASNSLTMTQGNIDAATFKITLGTSTVATGTLTYTAGAIIGKMERWIASTGAGIVFPVGTSSTNRSATLTFTNLTNGSLITQFVASNPGSSGLSLTEGGATVSNQFTEGYWDFTAANSLASTNYQVQLTGTGFTSYTLAPNTRVIKRTNGAGAWALQGTHADVSSSVASRSGLSGISTAQFGLGRTTCTAPTATVAQNVTTDVMQGNSNYEIIRIAVNSSSATCTDIITQFNFTTAGTPGCTAASTDISNAKVYYTGTSSTFATSTLFGSLGSAPNGAFAVNGTQNITSNTVYFWLTYDIPSSATMNHVVDGQLVSFVMGGTTINGASLTTPDPAGSRTIKGERYAVATGNWNATSTWAYTAGGASGASVPTALTDVYIPAGYTVTDNSSGALANNLYIQSGATAAKLVVTTGGALTCSSVSMTTTSKKAELYVQQTGTLTVNGNMIVDLTNLTEDALTCFQVNNSATVTITGNLSLVNPSAKKLKVILNGTSVTSVNGNISLSGNAADRVYLGMGGTARLNVKGTLSPAASKYGELYNTDGAYTSIINFNGTTAQTLYASASVANSNEWLYSIVWINNPAGVTLGASIVDATNYNSIRKSLYVKSGTLKTGGYSITMDNLATAVFQVDDNATYYSTTTDGYGGIPTFGTNQGSGKITFSSNSTVTFAGASQTIPILSGAGGSAYGNIICAGTGTKTIGRPHHATFGGTGALDINGNLTTNSGVVLDASASNYNITIAGNWTDQHAVAGSGFVERSGTVTFDGTTTQTVTPTASPMTFYNLTMNKSAGTFTLASDIVASNGLTMTAGNISTGSYKLTLGTSTVNVGTFSRTSGTIIGKFERWINATGTNIIFPVGTATYYRPDTLNFTQLTAGSLQVEFVASAATNTGLPVSESSVTVSATGIFTEGYWRCTAANSLASTNYNIRVGTSGFTSKILSSNVRLIKRANGASSWTLNGTHLSTTSTSARRNGLSGFSEFAVATVDCTPAVSASINVTSHACNNTSGALTLSTTNASAPVSYLWSTGATTQNLSGLSSGSYTVTVTDNNQCTATASAAVGVTASSMVVTHSTSYDSPTGAIDLTAGGGTAPYTYLWNDKDVTITTQDRTGLANGWYKVTITDAAGCKSVQSAMVAYMDTIHAGSYIIDMGVMPQTIANGLKPFGLISDMIRNQHVPVSWVINPNKTLYGADFELNGIEYKGGPFIIEAENIDNVIDSRITYWEGRGVVGDYTTTDIVVPVYSIITGFTNLGVDEANEGVVAPYFTNAEVPTDIYYVGLPSTLGACDNAYVLPHADPTWANHNLLKTFVQDNGYIWVGCHAVSALEGIFQPGVPANRMNFLSQTGLQCYSAGDCGSISEVHGDPTGPYTINTTLAAHPLMQFMGDLTPSTENGSEDWYIPVSTGGWNTGTYRAITTADGSYGKEGVKLVFGNGFDDKDNGLVMYEAGHTSAGKGTIASQVAAQRTFFNFILHSGFDRRLIAEVNAPASMAEGAVGALSLSITSGGAPFTYEWTTNVDGSFSAPNSASTNFTLNRGNGRDYARVTVLVTDNCGRIYFETKTIRVLYAAGPVTSSYGGYNISCNGGSDGTITVAGLGGSPPYTYNWSHGATTATVSHLPAGTYMVTITDAAMTTFYDTITLTEPPTALQDSVAITSTVTCYYDSTGGIDLTYSGGLSPYTIQWSNGASTEDISNLPPGDYSVTITDRNGCNTTSDTLSLGPDSLIVTEAITPASCNGATNGAIDLTLTGGTLPYSYLWSNSASTQDLTNIATGDYYVTITDGSACVQVDTFTVTQPTTLNLSRTGTNILCHGASTGAVDLSVSGGTTPYTYLWSSGASSQDISGKVAGAYTVTVTDDNGCTSSTSITLTEPAAVVSGSSTTTNITCPGGNNGAVDLTPAGGNSPYTYLWSGGQTTQDLSSRVAGAYTVTITDANGCTASHSKTLTEPASLSISPAVTNTTCPYSINGSINISPSGGTAPYTFVWSTGAVTEDISARPTGTYSITLTDAVNCTASSTGLTIASTSNIASNFFVVDVSVHNGSNGVINQTVSGGVAPYSYAWSHGSSSEDITNLTAATYTVTITDASGCTFTKSDVVEQPGACPCTWLGTTSSDWSVAANWDCGFVPGDTCNVIIQAAPNTCTIASGSGTCKDFTINPGITFEISGTATLNVYGDFTNNGTLVRNSSIVKFIGSVEQNISGNSPIRFYDLHIANTSATGVVMAENVEVYNELRLTDGYLFTGTDTLKMMSAASGKLTTFSANSFIVGRIWRNISNAPKVRYEFPVGDAGMPSRFFRACIETHALEGTEGLTVWFDSLKRHDDTEMITAFLDPPADVDSFYNYTVPYMKVTSGDTIYSTSYGTNTAVTGVGGNLSGTLLSSASTYVNQIFTLEKTVETDGFIYTHMASEGIWHFEPDEQPTGGFYNMLLYTANFSGLSDNNFGVLKRPAGADGTYWSGGGGIMKPFFGTGRALSHGFAMRLYLTTFSEGGIGGGGGSGLPIELLEFGAQVNDDAVDLTWVTATETRNAYFTIEKSDGETFREIAMIPGAGNSSTTRYYSDTDLEPFKGTSYYRLKQTDYDGQFTYSDVVSVTYIPASPMDEENVIIIYPNPTTGEFSVKIKNAVEKVSLALFDNGGKLILTDTYAANEDDHEHQMRLENVPNGVYHLKANLGSNVQYTRKVMLLRGN